MSRQPPKLSTATGSELFEGDASLVPVLPPGCPRFVWVWRGIRRVVGFRVPAPSSLAECSATSERASRSRQSELSAPPVLWDICIDHTSHPGDCRALLWLLAKVLSWSTIEKRLRHKKTSRRYI